MKNLFIFFLILLPISSYSQIWRETFDGLANNETEDTGPTKWTTRQPDGPEKVFSKQTYPGYVIFAVNNTGNEGEWISEEIDISSASEVAIEITWGSYWAAGTDYLRAYYIIDGGEEILFGEESGKPNLQVASAASAIVSGNKVQIIVKGRENTPGTYYGYPRMMGIDDVTVSELTYLYSRTSGLWNGSDTWSKTGYTGLSCGCIPDEDTHAFVGNGNMVNLNVPAKTAGLTIESLGRVNYTANALLAIVRGGVLDIKANSRLDKNGRNTSSLSFSTYSYNIAVEGSLSAGKLIVDAANVTFSGSGDISLAGDVEINNVVAKTITNNISGSFSAGDEFIFGASSGNFNFINNGNISVLNRMVFDHRDVLFTNNGLLKLGAGGISVNHDYDDGNAIHNSGTLSFGALSLNNADFVLNNLGTINQDGDFSGVQGGSAFRNLTGASWSFSGGGSNSRLFTAAPDNTFIYNRSGNQTIFVPADGAYHHLNVSGSGSKTTAADLTIRGDLTIGESAQLDVSAAANTLTLAGDWIVNSTNPDPFKEQTGNVIMSGAADQQIITGSGTETFNRLIIDKPGGNLILSSGQASSLAVTGSLNLLSGGLDINGNELIIYNPDPAAVTRTQGFVRSETSAAPYSRIRRATGTDSEAYEFPFGKTGAAEDFIPFTFEVTAAGAGAGFVSVATYATAADNLPYPDGVLNLGGNEGADMSPSVADRFWQIDLSGYEENPTATVTFTLTAEEAGTNSFLRAQRWNTSAGSWDQPLAGQTNPDLLSVVVPGVSQFSPWTLVDESKPMPVEMSYFKGVVHQNGVELEWQTARELHNDYFTVEKTQDFKTFHTLGIIKGKGTTDREHTYRFFDYSPYPGISYYRLKQTDTDGKFEYIGPVSVKWVGSNNRIVIHPNPSDGRELYIKSVDFTGESAIPVRLFNISGQQVFFSQVDSGDSHAGEIKLVFDKKLLPGLYLIKTGLYSHDRFIVH